MNTEKFKQSISLKASIEKYLKGILANNVITADCFSKYTDEELEKIYNNCNTNSITK